MANTWYITSVGWDLMRKLVAGEATFEISRTAIGNGSIGDTDPSDLTALVSEICDATSTTPYSDSDGIHITVEYRNDLNGEQEEDYTITEVGIFATDPDEGEILMYYADLSSYPETVPAYGSYPVTRRWTITLAFSTEGDITLNYTPDAYITADDLASYVAAALADYVTTEALEAALSG